jgi:hypothetical protein
MTDLPDSLTPIDSWTPGDPCPFCGFERFTLVDTVTAPLWFEGDDFESGTADHYVAQRVECRSDACQRTLATPSAE